MLDYLVQLNTVANMYGSWEYDVGIHIGSLGVLPEGDQAILDHVFDHTGIETLGWTLVNKGDLILLCCNHKPLYALELDISDKTYENFNWSEYDLVDPTAA